MLTKKNKSSIDYVDRFFTSLHNGIKNISSAISDNIGVFTTLFCVALYLLANMEPRDAICVGVAVYIMNLAKSTVNRYLDNEVMKDLDIERIGQSKDATTVLSKTSINEIIGQYVEDCFNRDVLFLNPPVAENMYIDKETEKEYLNDLLTSATNNISHLMYRKLSLYIGDEALSLLIGRKCLATVTIFVATHNHKIYDREGENNIIRTTNMPDNI